MRSDFLGEDEAILDLGVKVADEDHRKARWRDIEACVAILFYVDYAGPRRHDRPNLCRKAIASHAWEQSC